MAWARWKYPYTLTPEQKREKEVIIERDKPQYPEGTNVRLIHEFLGRLDDLRSKYVDEEKEYCKSCGWLSTTMQPKHITFKFFFIPDCMVCLYKVPSCVLNLSFYSNFFFKHVV